MPGSYSSRPQTSEAMGQDFAGPANHQAILRYVWVLIRGISGHGCVGTLFICLVDAYEWSDKTVLQSIYMDALHPGHRYLLGYRPRDGRVCRIPSHPHGGVGYDMRYKWTWMGCHIFQISCGCIGKVSQAWDVTHTLGCPPSRPQTTNTMGQYFAGFADHQTIHRDVWVLIWLWCIGGNGWVATHF